MKPESKCEACGAELREGARACPGLSSCWRIVQVRDEELRTGLTTADIKRVVAELYEEETHNLRDAIAVAALATAVGPEFVGFKAEDVATWAYSVADAVLVERAKRRAA